MAGILKIRFGLVVDEAGGSKLTAICYVDEEVQYVSDAHEHLSDLVAEVALFFNVNADMLPLRGRVNE